MTRSPILRALSSIRKSGAKTLLMGGQACVFYGAAEFSRDLDLLILVEAENLNCFRDALRNLQADPIAVPSFDERLLERGHAIHFRCRREDVAGLRIDLMSNLRGVDTFNELWERRTVINSDDETVDLMAVEDLVKAKKTQRDKDWPMIRRLIERIYYVENSPEPTARVEFLLRELRTPELLIELVNTHLAEAARIALLRPAVKAAIALNVPGIESALMHEEQNERERDRVYWEPLKRELEGFRRERRRSQSFTP